jgi:hypothetical protein
MGLTTYVSTDQENGRPLVFGQVLQLKDMPFARLTFLTPEPALESVDVVGLLEALITYSGDRGAFRLLAEVDEKTHAFESLRRSGFAIYTHQRIWKITNSEPENGKKEPVDTLWRGAHSKDAVAVRSLYANLVPGLVQQVETLSNEQTPSGLVFFQDGELLAFVGLTYGNRGILVQPFIHPDAEDITGQLISLIRSLPNRRSRPVYICIRSYQSWLEPGLEELDARPGPRQAVLVKHLAVLHKAVRPLAVPALETGQPEVTAPFAQTEGRT